VYASDQYGLPDVTSIVGEANPLATDVTRVYIPDWWGLGPRVFAIHIDLGSTAITGLDASGDTCYWLEVVNRLDGDCFWSWYITDTPNNDFSAVGGGFEYGIASARNQDMAFCLSTDFAPGACGSPVAYCCDCDGACSNETRRDCLSARSRWRIEDTCETHTCEPGAPDNDKCLNVVLPEFPDTPSGTVRFDNTCSNADGVNPIDSDFGPDNNIAADVWFKYIATCDGAVTFSTCANGPAQGGGLDTIIAVYRDPVDPTQCVCPLDSDAQREATLWYSEPMLPNTIGMAGDENCDGLQNGGGGYVQGTASFGDCFMIRVGGFGGQGSEEGQGTVTITCGYVDPPFIWVVPIDGGNRYIRVEVLSEEWPEDMVLRVKVISLDGYAVPAPDYLYVGAPSAAPEEDAAKPGQVFTAAPLSCEPYAHNWRVEGAIAIYGAEILPGSTYEVQAAFANCLDLANESCWALPVTTIETLAYGDVWPIFAAPGNPPQPDFNDVAAMVRKFQSAPSTCTGGANDRLPCAGGGDCPDGTCAVTAPLKAMAQLQPNSVFPDRPIDFKDIATDVAAFRGATYSSANVGPCTCPSSVTCGATPCVNDLACTGGLCVDGFCRDACGRCSP